MHLLKFFLNLYDWFVKNKSVTNFHGFRTKSALSCCDAKGFIQSCSQTSYSPLYIGPVRLTYFQLMFHLWRNHLIDLHQRNMQKHTHVEKWHVKDMESLTWTWNITFPQVFFTQFIGFSKIETLVAIMLRNKTVLKYFIISATRRRRGRIKTQVHYRTTNTHFFHTFTFS